jgi:UDP-N-acetylmuramyl pentapeptide phosphotransferase/UDP-N-acetylglucosamine-1-phosphate transferase
MILITYGYALLSLMEVMMRSTCSRATQHSQTPLEHHHHHHHHHHLLTPQNKRYKGNITDTLEVSRLA